MERITIRKKILIALGVTVGSMILIYLGFALYFTNHFYFNTIINGRDYSYKTEQQAEEFAIQRTKEYKLKIIGREELEDEILGEAISLTYIPEGNFSKIIKEQPPLLWITSLFGMSEYDMPMMVQFEENSFSQAIDTLLFWKPKNINKPEDAYLEEYSLEDKNYKIVPEYAGTQLDKEKSVVQIKNAITSLAESIDLNEKGCYTEPRITKNDKGLQRIAAILNKYVSAEISYQLIEGSDIVDGDKIHEWILVENGKIGLDEEKIRAYINALAKEYDTYGKKRMFHTTDGRDLELPSGAFGWKIDRAEETQALISHIESGEVVKKEPLYSAEGAVKKKEDIGNTFVEIDLGNQHLYLYKEGNLILETDFVSGNMIKGWGTPAGVFGLTYKTRDAVLRGENYRTPVKYWMPFNGNVGMHDATWRKSFGGDIFITNGSHGCVNLPIGMAKQIYEFVYKGIPVICYYD